MFAAIKAIVFDLDGTLYLDDELAEEIKSSAKRYIASLKGIDNAAAGLLIEATQARLSAATGQQTSLTFACTELGGDIRQLHEHFASEIMPEQFLKRNEVVVKLLQILSQKYELYLYTNNNHVLCGRIVDCLGIGQFFRRLFTIEYTWRPKPDMDTLQKVLSDIGSRPEECVFVGDRYDVDLRLPETLGSQITLVRGEAELEPLLQKLVEWNADIKVKGEGR